jgi:sugar lactone lactonase YvrE
MNRRCMIVSGLLVTSALSGCGASEDALPTSPHTKVELVADEGFRNAGAVAASPDGETFYVAAHTEDDRPAVFAVNAKSGAVEPLHAGPPLLYPSDLATSCDGDEVFVSDMGLGEVPDDENAFADLEDQPRLQLGGIHVLASDGSSIDALEAKGIGRAAGLVVSTDCSTLYVTGWTEAGMPAVFTVPVTGGSASVLYEGAPLVSPTGVHVDAQSVAWVMDHLARSDDGEGMLFAIDGEGSITEVAAGLAMGRHGGVSLTPGGTTAVIPVDDEISGPRLVTANTESGEVATMETPDIEKPTGVAAATQAPVMVIAGENSIHIATFE